MLRLLFFFFSFFLKESAGIKDYLRTSHWWTVTLDFIHDIYYVLVKQQIWAVGLLLTILLNEYLGVQLCFFRDTDVLLLSSSSVSRDL